MNKLSPNTLTVASCLLSVAFFASPARSEGSRELTANGGYRPHLEYRNSSLAGIPRRTTVNVYAEVNEYLNLASSAQGLGSGTINYRTPSGGSGSCTTNGLIASRAQEASPANAPTYTPCSFMATETGIWEIEFISPDPTASGGSPSPARAIPANATWETLQPQQTDDAFITAWDVTVSTGGALNAGGTAQSGRVFVNYFRWTMASNSGNPSRIIGGSTVALNSQAVVLTDQGFQYAIDLNGIDPFGFTFFANNKGFQDSTGEPIYRSLQFEGSNPGTIPSGYSIHLPSNPDTADDITHKIFLNNPDTSMPSSAPSASGTTWLYQPAVVPAPPTDFGFTGTSGTSGFAFTSPAGGNFSFVSNGTTTGTYTLILDLNQNGTLGDGNDRTLIGRALPGANTVSWDGLDGNGDAVPASSVVYQTELTTAFGEVHFPIFDPENNPNGLIIQRITPTDNPPDPANIYYDDSNTGTDFTLCAQGETGVDCYGTAPNPRSALLGTSSSGGAHAWSNNFGDRRGIDTWVNFPLFPSLEGSFTISDGTTTTTTTETGTSNLRIVKRITDITRDGSTLSGVDFASFVDDPGTTDDNASGWSSLSPIGIYELPDTTLLTSGDVVEYTLYLLSDGDLALSGANLCDPIPEGTGFVFDTYGSDRGILLRQGSSETAQTNDTADTDEGQFYEALTPVALDACSNANNPNGSVVIEGFSLTNTATDNVGFIRFRVTVN